MHLIQIGFLTGGAEGTRVTETCVLRRRGVPVLALGPHLLGQTGEGKDASSRSPEADGCTHTVWLLGRFYLPCLTR